MSPDPVTQEDLDSQARNAPLTRPRPGHADLVGMQKFGHADAGRSWSGPAPARPRPGSRSARSPSGCLTRPWA